MRALMVLSVVYHPLMRGRVLGWFIGMMWWWSDYCRWWWGYQVWVWVVYVFLVW